MKKTILTLSLLVGIFSFVAQAGESPDPIVPSSASLTVMSYNVENLFDTKHDAGKDDGEYLPKNDPEHIRYCQKQKSVDACLKQEWNDSRLELKLEQIKKVVALTGEKPDLMGLVEVENDSVVGMLAAKLNYKEFKVTNSPDDRGIDVALMYNPSAQLKFISSQTYSLDVRETIKATRDILEVQFEVGAQHEKLAVFVNHWPSQSWPVTARWAAAKELARLTQERINQKMHVLVMGDFNVVDLSDQPSPFLPLILPSTSSTSNGQALTDVYLKMRTSAKDLRLDLSHMPVGTYFYGPFGQNSSQPDMVWNMLDRFFVSPSLLGKAGLRVDLSSFRIFSHPEIVTNYRYEQGIYKGTEIQGVPKRYNHFTDDVTRLGYSDHLPILMRLSL